MLPAVRDSGVFDAVTFGGTVSALVTASGETRTRAIYFVTPEFFATLGVKVQMGRDFIPADDQRGVPPVAILSDRLWRTTFAADPAVLGRTIEIERRPITVIGVAARGFPGMSLSQPSDLYLPLQTAREAVPSQSNLFAEPNPRMSPTSWVSAFARLGRADRPEIVSQRLGVLLPNLGKRTPALVPVELNALPEASRAPMEQFARLLAITTGLLLLVGCLTVGMLLLLRTEARQGEFAVCLALGASRARLAAGIALEGGLLSALGAALSLPAAAACFGALRALRLPGGISIETLDLRLDTRVLAAVVIAAGATGVVIALVSGVFGFRASVANVMRTREGSTPQVTRRRTRAILLASQVAATLVLVSGAGLFARSLAAALHVNPGFDTTRLVTTTLSPSQYRYTPALAVPFFADLRDRLAANPAIRSASIISTGVGMSSGSPLIVDGVERRFPSVVAETGVDDRYFKTVGLPILRGRDFTARDDDSAPLVTIVSESFGRMLASGGNPLGMKIRAFHGKADQSFPTIEVVGVVPDVITNVNQLQPLAMYMSLPQTVTFWTRTLLLRPTTTVADATREAVATLKAIEASIDPAPPIASPLMTLDEKILSQMAPQRFGVVVLGALGAIALLLTILGTYVLAESMAAVRTREMGVRAALGATGRDLGSIILIESARLVGVGIVAGLAIAWLQANTVKAFLFRVEPLDPLTLASVAGLIMTLALAVSLRPALAAARLDLARVLRDQ
jgi:putative ABC transport system permease protein